jgi:hypothetical protein
MAPEMRDEESDATAKATMHASASRTRARSRRAARGARFRHEMPSASSSRSPVSGSAAFRRSVCCWW